MGDGKKLHHLQSGPLPVVNGIITPLLGVKQLQLHIYKAHFVVVYYNSMYNYRPGTPSVLFFEATLPREPATMALKIGLSL